MATCGSTPPMKVCQLLAEAMAISDSSSEVGLMFRPQSAKISVPSVPNCGVLGAHDEEGRDELGARGGLQDLQRGAQGVGGGVAGAGDQAVGVAHLDHHGAVVGGVVHLGAGLLDGHALLGAQLGELLRVLLVLVGAAGVDDGDARHVDLVGVAQDDQVGEALLDDDLGGLDGALVLAPRGGRWSSCQPWRQPSYGSGNRSCYAPFLAFCPSPLCASR